MVVKFSIGLFLFLMCLCTVLRCQSLPVDSLSRTDNYTLSGTVNVKKTGETLIASTIRVLGSPKSTLSNEYGFYSITLPKGKYTVEVKALGFKKYSKPLQLENDTSLNIEMLEEVTELATVNINASPIRRNLENAQMGIEQFSIKETSNIPVLLGERDIIKTIQLLPGVKNGGEGNGGFFVRGGSADQNMILLDESPIYNASHLLGFFSTFNADAIKNVTLYKSGMPAQYGG